MTTSTQASSYSNPILSLEVLQMTSQCAGNNKTLLCTAQATIQGHDGKHKVTAAAAACDPKPVVCAETEGISDAAAWHFNNDHLLLTLINRHNVDKVILCISGMHW